MCYPAFDYKGMGARMRARRIELGLTQEGLAERIGVSASFVGHIERGEKKASLETIAHLGEALGMSLDYLIIGRKMKCEGMRCELYADLIKLIGAYQ